MNTILWLIDVQYVPKLDLQPISRLRGWSRHEAAQRGQRYPVQAASRSGHGRTPRGAPVMAGS